MTLRAMNLAEPKRPLWPRLKQRVQIAGEWALYAVLTLVLLELILG